MEYQSTNISSNESDISESDDDNDTQTSTITLQDSNDRARNIFKQLPHLKKKAIIYYYLNVLNAPRKRLWYGTDGAIVKIIKALNIGRVTNYNYSAIKKILEQVYTNLRGGKDAIKLKSVRKTRLDISKQEVELIADLTEAGISIRNTVAIVNQLHFKDNKKDLSSASIHHMMYALQPI